MELKLCANDDGQQAYAKGLCKSCYFKQHDAGRNYKKRECRNGHLYAEGSYKLSSTGKRVCLLCLDERRKIECPNGHAYSADNVFYVNGTPQCKTCRNQRMRDRRPAKGIGPGGLNKAKTRCPRGHAYDEENTGQAGGRRYCRICARHNGRIQRLKNYHLTPEQFDNILARQNFACAVCREPIDESAHVDHDHGCCDRHYSSCGECVRGVLCGTCNQGLGSFRDKIDLLGAAIEYLESFAKPQELPVLAGAA